MPDSAAPLPAADLRCRVLYIEDQPLGMAFVEELLAAFPGVTLIKATTGREGIEMARSERPDLVLLDMHLPDISGLEVVRALNELIATGVELCRFSLTGRVLSVRLQCARRDHQGHVYRAVVTHSIYMRNS